MPNLNALKLFSLIAALLLPTLATAAPHHQGRSHARRHHVKHAKHAKHGHAKQNKHRSAR